jgi:hypothetical protein
MRAKPNLVSLCGITDDATEADLSDLGMDADDAIVLASELPDKGALLVLSLKENNLYAAGAKALGEGLKGNQTITELDLAGNGMGRESAKWSAKDDMSGIITLADAITDMGAMTSLNLASNNICYFGNMDGIKAISSALQVLVIILVPFSSLSDLRFNCWCLLLSSGYGGPIGTKFDQEWIQGGRGRQSPR